MTSTENTAETRSCLRCVRMLRSAEALATGYGAGCRAKIRQAEAAVDLSAWTPRQIEDARELIEDGGVVPTARPGVFRTVSSDGTEVYLTSAGFCGCAAGRKARRCYHRAAVAIVLATAAPAPRPELAPTPAPVSAPVAASADIWAEMDRWNDAFMAMT